MRLSKIQISLRIRAVWSDSSPCVFWIANDAKCLHADNTDSDQTEPMSRLIWVVISSTYQGYAQEPHNVQTTSIQRQDVVSWNVMQRRFNIDSRQY